MADDVAVSVSPASCNWNSADVAAVSPLGAVAYASRHTVFVGQVPQGGAALQVAPRRPLVLPAHVKCLALFSGAGTGDYAAVGTEAPSLVFLDLSSPNPLATVPTAAPPRSVHAESPRGNGTVVKVCFCDQAGGIFVVSFDLSAKTAGPPVAVSAPSTPQPVTVLRWYPLGENKLFTQVIAAGYTSGRVGIVRASAVLAAGLQLHLCSAMDHRDAVQCLQWLCRAPPAPPADNTTQNPFRPANEGAAAFLASSGKDGCVLVWAVVAAGSADEPSADGSALAIRKVRSLPTPRTLVSRDPTRFFPMAFVPGESQATLYLGVGSTGSVVSYDVSSLFHQSAADSPALSFAYSPVLQGAPGCVHYAMLPYRATLLLFCKDRAVRTFPLPSAAAGPSAPGDAAAPPAGKPVGVRLESLPALHTFGGPVYALAARRGDDGAVLDRTRPEGVSCAARPPAGASWVLGSGDTSLHVKVLEDGGVVTCDVLPSRGDKVTAVGVHPVLPAVVYGLSSGRIGLAARGGKRGKKWSVSDLHGQPKGAVYVVAVAKGVYSGPGHAVFSMGADGMIYEQQATPARTPAINLTTKLWYTKRSCLQNHPHLAARVGSEVPGAFCFSSARDTHEAPPAVGEGKGQARFLFTGARAGGNVDVYFVPGPVLRGQKDTAALLPRLLHSFDYPAAGEASPQAPGGAGGGIGKVTRIDVFQPFSIDGSLLAAATESGAVVFIALARLTQAALREQDGGGPGDLPAMLCTRGLEHAVVTHVCPVMDVRWCGVGSATTADPASNRRVCRTAAASASYDWTAQVWGVEATVTTREACGTVDSVSVTVVPLRSFREHLGRVFSVAWVPAPRGGAVPLSFLVTASDDHTSRTFDAGSVLAGYIFPPAHPQPHPAAGHSALLAPVSPPDAAPAVASVKRKSTHEPPGGKRRRMGDEAQWTGAAAAGGKEGGTPAATVPGPVAQDAQRGAEALVGDEVDDSLREQLMEQVDEAPAERDAAWAGMVASAKAWRASEAANAGIRDPRHAEPGQPLSLLARLARAQAAPSVLCPAAAGHGLSLPNLLSRAAPGCPPSFSITSRLVQNSDPLGIALTPLLSYPTWKESLTNLLTARPSSPLYSACALVALGQSSEAVKVLLSHGLSAEASLVYWKCHAQITEFGAKSTNTGADAFDAEASEHRVETADEDEESWEEAPDPADTADVPMAEDDDVGRETAPLLRLVRRAVFSGCAGESVGAGDERALLRRVVAGALTEELPEVVAGLLQTANTLVSARVACSLAERCHAAARRRTAAADPKQALRLEGSKTALADACDRYASVFCRTATAFTSSAPQPCPGVAGECAGTQGTAPQATSVPPPLHEPTGSGGAGCRTTSTPQPCPGVAGECVDAQGVPATPPQATAVSSVHEPTGSGGAGAAAAVRHSTLSGCLSCAGGGAGRAFAPRSVEPPLPSVPVWPDAPGSPLRYAAHPLVLVKLASEWLFPEPAAAGEANPATENAPVRPAGSADVAAVSSSSKQQPPAEPAVSSGDGAKLACASSAVESPTPPGSKTAAAASPGSKQQLPGVSSDAGTKPAAVCAGVENPTPPDNAADSKIVAAASSSSSNKQMKPAEPGASSDAGEEAAFCAARAIFGGDPPVFEAQTRRLSAPAARAKFARHSAGYLVVPVACGPVDLPACFLLTLGAHFAARVACWLAGPAAGSPGTALLCVLSALAAPFSEAGAVGVLARCSARGIFAEAAAAGVPTATDAAFPALCAALRDPSPSNIQELVKASRSKPIKAVLNALRDNLKQE
ncbi:hypothetical protein DIPPA_05946 [Diplonema papillatum]|nr:hypothetical protein DIPPA_05946 [Diplonema papillatum]